jgi:type I restriction enzyme S subunit
MKSTMRFADFVEVNPEAHLKKGQTYPFVNMESVRPGRRFVHATQIRPAKGGGARFLTGDTLFARITPCLENGKIAQFAGPDGEIGFGSTEFLVFRARPNISDPGYVFYLASTDIIRKPAEKSMRGASGRQRADLASIKDIQVPAPSLPTQRKIAAILSIYDDLIKNNTRRIKILEEMARAIYREWFVHFRFPDHEKVKLVDSQLGKIPEGWEVRKVTEAIWINPPTKVPKDGDKPYIPMASLSNDSMLIAELECRTGNNGSKFKNLDTLFARITPCLENGKTGYVQFLPSMESVGLGSTEFIVLRSKTVCPEYVYLMARSDEFRDNAIKSMSGATGRQRVQEECFEKCLFAHPDQKSLAFFVEQVSPLFGAVHVLAEKNANLCRTRDLLLPNLISGEMDVDAIAINPSGPQQGGL